MAANPRDAIDAVPPRGYRWWYVDALSDDGRRGFTAIFLVGSVFSPAYAARVRRGEAAPATDHLGVHVALYEDGRELAWGMSEYPATALSVRQDGGGAHLAIGRSTLTWGSDGALDGRIDERTAPIFWSLLGLGAKLRGGFSLSPAAGPSGPEVELARSIGGERHLWQVDTTNARIRVDFERPRFTFEGRAYQDTNWGDGRLETAFSRWGWARFHDGAASRVLYAVEPRDAPPRGFVLDGGAAVAPEPARFAATAKVGWGLSAPDHFEVGAPDHAHRISVEQILDCSPFYMRYVARLDGARGVGEYLDLDRFRRPGVQFLLPFRTRRQK